MPILSSSLDICTLFDEYRSIGVILRNVSVGRLRTKVWKNSTRNSRGRSKDELITGSREGTANYRFEEKLIRSKIGKWKYGLLTARKIRPTKPHGACTVRRADANIMKPKRSFIPSECRHFLNLEFLDFFWFRTRAAFEPNKNNKTISPLQLPHPRRSRSPCTFSSTVSKIINNIFVSGVNRARRIRTRSFRAESIIMSLV